MHICKAPYPHVQKMDTKKDKRFVAHITDIKTILELHQKGISVPLSSNQPIFDSRSREQMLEDGQNEVNKTFANPINLNAEFLELTSKEIDNIAE